MLLAVRPAAVHYGRAAPALPTSRRDRPRITSHAMAAKADAMVAADQQQARADLWKQIFDKIMTDDAPWVPVFNEIRYTIHSPRVGGADALFVDPVHVPVNYSYIYATDAQ